jgi:hypothetical protein
MQITFASEGVPGRVNEDYAACGPDWAIVLDGATAPAGVDSGCIHDVAWLVRQIVASLSRSLILAALPLPDVLAAAISETCQAHAGTCDLANPDSPSSTVAIIRVRDGVLDYLVLGDSPVILRKRDGVFMPVHDDRTDHLPGGRPYSFQLVREHRNQPGGFWVASTNTQAAREALSGSIDIARGMEAALLTDGVTRLVDWYGYDWPAVFAVLRAEGPTGLISRVRSAEDKAPPSYGKAHDDATALYVTALD